MLKNKTILFSGVFEGYERKDLENLAVAHGATLLSSVTKKLDFLVAGEKMGPAKLDKASSLQIPILSLSDFLKMTGNKPTFQMDIFDLNESPENLSEKIKNCDWKKFDVKENGKHLRDFLIQYQEKHGITAAHKQISAELKSKLNLIHPFTHDYEIGFSDISFDLKYLAIGSWMGADYDRGGVLQIWEMETGRVVNNIRVHGGVAWPDEKGIEWSPTELLVASTFDTNGVGVFDPFSPNDCYLWAYVTDGMDHPPYFTWSNDGERIFIKFIIDAEWDDDGNLTNGESDEGDRGCWFNVKNCKGDAKVKVGVYNEPEKDGPLKTGKGLAIRHKIKDKRDCYKGPNNEFVFAGGDGVTFYSADGKLIADYKERNPNDNSPLMINGSDLGEFFSMNPAFGLQVGDEIEWFIAFENGSIVAPKDFPIEKHINYSLGYQYYWPMEWCDVVRAESLQDLAKIKDAIPAMIKSQIKSLKPQTKTKGPKTWPTSTDKTYDDLLNLAKSTFPSLNDYYINEYSLELAICEVRRGKPESAWEIISNLKGRYTAYAAAECAFQCIKLGFDPSKFVQKAEKSIDEGEQFDRFVDRTAMAKMYYVLGNNANGLEWEKKAVDFLDQETNRGQHKWPHFEMLYFSGRKDKAMEFALDTKLGDSMFCENIIYNFLWYLPEKEFLELNKFIIENNILENHKMYPFLKKRIFKERNWELLDEYSVLLGYYKEYLIRELFKNISQETPENQLLLANYFLNRKKDQYYLQVLFFSHQSPVLKELVETHFANLTDNFKDLLTNIKNDYNTSLNYMGYFVAKLGDKHRWTREIEKLENKEKACYYAGLASGNTGEKAEELLTKAVSFVPTKLDYNTYLYWVEILRSCYYLNSPQTTSYLKQTIEICSTRDKDYDLDNLQSALQHFAPIQAIYDCYIKMSKSSRTHRVYGIFNRLCAEKNYNGVYDLSELIMGADQKGQYSSLQRAMNTLADSRGYRYEIW